MCGNVRTSPINPEPFAAERRYRVHAPVYEYAEFRLVVPRGQRSGVQAGPVGLVRPHVRGLGTCGHRVGGTDGGRDVGGVGRGHGNAGDDGDAVVDGVVGGNRGAGGDGDAGGDRGVGDGSRGGRAEGTRERQQGDDGRPDDVRHFISADRDVRPKRLLLI